MWATKFFQKNRHNCPFSNNLMIEVDAFDRVPADILRDELIRIDSELNRALLLVNANHGGDVIDLNIAAKYKSLVMGLTPDNLGDEEKNKIRDLIASVKPMPFTGNVLAEVNIDLEGFISPDTKRPAYGNRGESSMMVAGAGFEPTTFGL